MSDFLVSIGTAYSGDQLLSVIKLPYGASEPQGCSFDFPWGSLAVLEEPLAGGRNAVRTQDGVVAWVGDLVGCRSAGLIEPLAVRLAELRSVAPGKMESLDRDACFARLNGAFAIVQADPTGVSIVTDPLSFTQVFAGQDSAGRTVALGTHADIVSVLGDPSADDDVVSMAQFLRRRYCTYPHTTHANVNELPPGSVHQVIWSQARGCQSANLSYWLPPEEDHTRRDENEWADQLRETLLAAVRDRCDLGTVGVALSGGLDSRVVMGAVPEDVECVGLTLCGTLNREALVAQRVATAYGRAWSPLVREPEYLAQNIVGPTRFVGCECFALHAHLSGFGDVLAGKVDAILTGDLSDTLLRAYCAADHGYRTRLKGFLPRRYEKVPFDYLHAPTDIWDAYLSEDVLAGMKARYIRHYDDHAMCGRNSVAEWLKIYPFRQWVEVAVWAVHRRMLPIRLPFADRRVLDFGFACPVEYKLGSRVFLKASRSIFGKAIQIPSANDGVKPCSGHWSRLAQRAVRKCREGVVEMLARVGVEPPVEHSWHDYQKYWSQSIELQGLRDAYASNLGRLDGTLFQKKSRDLLNDRKTHWEAGFGLLQVAIWLGQMDRYRAEMHKLSSGGSSVQIEAN